MKEDDDEEQIVTAAGVARYPCMPSEVALQQMRNRMQLAKLGKKLMKWTALATNREMRLLGQELETTYQEFNEKLHEAYIILARSRYFNPNLNNIVTENVEKRASVLVESRQRARSGVKVMLQEVKETNHDPYTYLGIEKGGEIIMEAKKQWLEIIRMTIAIMQLRATFMMVEKANKAANKKKNVFTKIIIPRTHETITYIESGLEELAREDFFRLRRFIYKKRSSQESNQERKPIQIKEKLIPKASKRVHKKECYMCGAFLGFSLLDERENFLEGKRIEELRTQMNEMLQIAKKLEEQGILDVNVDEFIVTAGKLKEKLEKSSSIDHLCKICREILKRRHEKEIKKQEVLQPEQNVNIEAIAFKPEALSPIIAKTTEKKDKIKMFDIKTKFDTFTCTPTQDLKEIIDQNENLNLKSLGDHHELERSKNIAETFTGIYPDAKKDFAQSKDSVELSKNVISTITITKELKSESSEYNQYFFDSPLEASVEKIKRVVTDEKENKLFVEEQIIITIKEKLKDEKITKSTPSQTLKPNVDDKHNHLTQGRTESTLIKISSRLSSEKMGGESRKRDSMPTSGLPKKRGKISREPTRSSSLTLYKDQLTNELPQSHEIKQDSQIYSETNCSKVGQADDMSHAGNKKESLAISTLPKDYLLEEPHDVKQDLNTEPTIEQIDTLSSKQKEEFPEETNKIRTPRPSLISSEGALSQEPPQTDDDQRNTRFTSYPTISEPVEKTERDSLPNLTTKEELQDEISKRPSPPPSLLSLKDQFTQKRTQKNNENVSLRFISLPKIIESRQVSSTSFTDITMSDTTIKDDVKNETMKRSTSLPVLYLSIDEPQLTIAQTNNVMDDSNLLTEEKSANGQYTMPYTGTIVEDGTAIESGQSPSLKIENELPPNESPLNDTLETSTESKPRDNEEVVYTPYTSIQIEGLENDEPVKIDDESVKTSKDRPPEKRVQINDARQTNSEAPVTNGVTPRGSISYAGASGVYIPPQNPREIVSEPCISGSATTLLSTELDTNRE